MPVHETLYRLLRKSQIRLRHTEIRHALRYQEATRNLRLLARRLAIHLYYVNAVFKYRVDFRDIVEREYKEGALHINRHPRELAVLEVIILRRVRKMRQNRLDLLALRRTRDLVELIELKHWVHAVRRNKGFYDFPLL